MTTQDRSGWAARIRRFARHRPWYLDLRLAFGLAVAAFAIWAFSMLFEDVWDRDPLVRWDAAVAQWVHRHTTPRGVRIFGAITQLGSSTFILMMAAAIAPALRRQRALLAGWVIVFATGMGLEWLLKSIMRRTRPPYATVYMHNLSYSFPSGHAMASMIGYSMLAFLIVRLANVRGARRVLVYVATGALILMIGVSRIYLGVHYPSDVLAGYAAGAAWVALCLTGIRAAERRARERG